MNQIYNLPVDITQVYYPRFHMKTQLWSLSQLHHLHQINLPVDTHPHSQQNKHERNSLTLSPQHMKPKIYQNHYL